MANYLLAKHVFFCVRGGEAIFLDLKADKYLAMDADKAERVMKLLPGYSPRREMEASRSPAEPDEAVEKTVRSFLKRGLLTTDEQRGKEAKPETATPPVTDLLAATDTLEFRVRLMDILKFFTAVVIAWTLVRFQPLERVVNRVKERRERHSRSGAELDARAAEKCVAVFERMRPYVFSARDQCLFESLVLIEFLARYGLYPNWVFAVQTSPFGAHCWVQSDGTVFNDSVEHASEFTPIMIV